MALALGLSAGCAMSAADHAPGAAALPAALCQAVLDDAHQRAPGTPPRIAAVQSLVWSDGALGCPEPGRLYTQALVPGWRIQVQVGDAMLAYHASQRGAWRHCPAGRQSQPAADDRAR